VSSTARVVFAAGLTIACGNAAFTHSIIPIVNEYRGDTLLLTSGSVYDTNFYVSYLSLRGLR
jgi:hypothetical protein